MKYTILIVDDMMLNIEILSSILDEEYTVMAAVSGENAFKLLERKTPDLVLLDVSMPGIDGFEVLRYIKEHERLANIPVIFVTAEHDELSEAKGLMMGAVDYIKKPYNATIVGVKVRNHIELKGYRDNLESLVNKRTKQLAASREAVIMGMALMSESHDKVTGAHIERIKSFTGILTQKIISMYPGIIEPDLAEQIVLFSTLHDVGKVSVSDVILKKTGILTPEEFDIMKSHTLEGAALLRKTESFLAGGREARGMVVAAEIAECHHERFDGTGYPHGLSGEDIPISARIVSVADVYDALRSPRPYKAAFTHEEAVSIILSGDGRTDPKHFDPKVLEAFNIVHPEFEELHEW